MAAGPIIQPVNVDALALLALHAAFPQRYPAFFESSAQGDVVGRDSACGRFDILFACPDGSLTLGRDGVLVDPDGRRTQGEFLSELDRWWQQERSRPAPPPQPSPAERGRESASGPAGSIQPSTGRPTDSILSSRGRPTDSILSSRGRPTDSILSSTGRPTDSIQPSTGRPTDSILSSEVQWSDSPLRSPASRGRAGRGQSAAATLPFTGGWLLYLGYELAGQIEPRLRLQPPAAGPIAQAIRVPAAIVHDRRAGSSWIVAEPRARSLIQGIAEDIDRRMQPAQPAALVRGAVTEDEPEQYLQAVGRALEYIAAGDVYQANLSRGWRALLHEDVRPHHLYRRLRETNPAPFSAVAIIGDIAVISSSPERLVEVRDGFVTTRPIAGTRPRGPDPAADQDLARELYAHPKERAEHVMLIDLERNDLGRVCEAGSVHVEEFMTIESYAHVHHIVSGIRGKLRTGATPGRVLAAVFPGGTITGCPKVRCMEIIAELEGGARGAYTGSLGYLNLDGSMDMNILIRSLEVRGAELSLRAGAGIVADSVAERELEETRDKARGVLRALSADAGTT